MNHRQIAVALLAAGLISPVKVSGAPASHAGEQARIPQVERRIQQLTDATRNTKGAPQQELLLRREKLRSLVDRLERGEDVDPREIDRLLER